MKLNLSSLAEVLPVLVVVGLLAEGSSHSNSAFVKAFSSPLDSTPHHSGTRTSIITPSGLKSPLSPSSYFSSSTRLQVSTSTSAISTDDSRRTVENDNESEDENQRKIRPLHQNWWPVSTVEALDSSRPNAVKLLGMDLVLFQNESGDMGTKEGEDQYHSSWACLQDRCAHRFAPLSEGRVISASDNGNDTSTSNSNSNSNHLQCAYHGWEFDNDGACQRVPQLANDKQQKGAIKNCNVKNFPTRVDCGMVFVWADPETANLGQLIPLPTFPLLKDTIETKGESQWFMRDLPYGYELLGENLLDLSHLPFSHHSVGNLKRDIGGPLPFKMLSAKQRSSDNPLFEAILEDASNTDPIFIGNPSATSESTLNLGFYEPCHVRYTRKTPTSHNYVTLFFCPTTSSKSRVFLTNLFSPVVEKDKKDEKKTIFKKPSISGIKKKLLPLVLKFVFTPEFIHQQMHKIFDGDGIFLRMQGDRMQREGLTFRDYKTPTSADVLVNAFRRYIHNASRLTKKEGKDRIAEAAYSETGYGNVISREEMLDRYHSHTKNCKICSAALERRQSKKKRIQLAKTILNGGIGASSTTLLTILGLLYSGEVAAPAAVLRVTSKVLLACVGSSVVLSKLDSKNDKAIQQFMFEDYIHADKD
jgi:pheophorbide a oxygenase